MTSGSGARDGLLLAVLGLVGLVRGRLGRGLRNRTPALAVARRPGLRAGCGCSSPTADAQAGQRRHLRPPPLRARAVRCPGGDPGRGSSATTRARDPKEATPPTPRPPDDAGGDDDEPDRRAGTTTPAPGPRPRPSPRPCPSRAGRRAPATTATQFGQAWADTDRNGCDTRNDILAPRPDRRDVQAPAPTAASSSPGTLADPYTGQHDHLRPRAGTQRRVQIDHVVALSDAWQKGAQQWTHATGAPAFANDPLNLLAVDGPTNQAKGDGDAATWLPPNKSYRCAYVARQVAVKARYGLWVTAAERDAIRRVLTSCPGQRLPDRGRHGPPGRRPSPRRRPAADARRRNPPAPAPATTAGGRGTGPALPVLRAASAAGYGPYRSGADPEYDWYRDRDHDGVVCER